MADDPHPSGGISWVSMTYPWTVATFLWADNPDVQGGTLMAGWFWTKPIYAVFKDAAGDIIGYRRAKACRAVSQKYDGSYTFGAQRYSSGAGGEIVYIEALTDFDDAVGVQAAAVALVVNATLAPDVPAGRLWLDDGDLIGGQTFAEKAVSIPLRRTVRDKVKFLVRF